MSIAYTGPYKKGDVKKAELLGIKPETIFIDDVREEFVKDVVFPMFRANARYETPGGTILHAAHRGIESLYSMQHVTFDEDQGAYNQRDAEGFIKLNALRLRLRAMGHNRLKS